MITGRKTIAVDKELAERLTILAKNEGKTIYSIINELIKSALHASETFNESCTEILSTYEDLMIARDIGLSLMPQSVSDIAYAVAFKDGYGKNLMFEYSKWGEWLGSYLKTRFPGKELKALFRISKVMFWKDANLEFEKNPENDPQELVIKIYGSAVKKEYISCIAVAFEKILEAFEFHLTNKDILKGICKLEFKK
ncbi:MAG: hypothetical protein ACTSRW_08890 [Candidatus Helarchaeota archaeon]